MLKSIKTSVLALILVGTAIMAHAQTKISEGTAEYDVVANGVASTTKIDFNGDVSKMTLVQGPATIMIITDVKNMVGVVAVSVPVAQIMSAAKMTKTDIEAERAKTGKASDFVATGEKKMVAGYNAEKYTYKGGDGGKYEVWVTTDLETTPNSFTGEFLSIKGTPVMFTGKDTSVTLKSIKEAKVGALSVTTVPSGYDEITYAELRAMGGGE